jgi:acyl-CoA synthetase (AMP-forming)/AMP-acid ligase II
MNLRDFTIYDVFKRNAALFKDKTAILYEDKEITFGELFEKARAVAGWLKDKGIVKGDRIAVLTKNCHHFFTLMGGIAALGGIMVPINFRLVVDEIGYVLSDTAPVMLFFDPDFEKIVSDLRSTCPSLREVVTFGSSVGGSIPFDSLLTSLPVSAVGLSGDDPFVIMHTAAVQGRPRGALISHRNLISCSIQTASTVSLTHEDIYLNILPLFHIAGFVLALSVMHASGKNVVLSKFDQKVVAKMIDRLKVTVIGDFPPILAQLLDEQAAGETTFSSLKNVLGVEVPDTVKRFESLGHGRFWLVYGQTETMGWTCLCTNSERPGSAGKPGPLVDLKIIDEFDRDADIGKPGEMVIRGPLVFQGYWKEEQLSKHTFRQGWHHTGDIGRVDEKGYLWFVGRKAEKELIKPGGENVYPVEVEKVILEHPGIAEVSVIGVPDPKFGEGIKAVCVLKPNIRLSGQELIDFVAERIARYKKPGYVTFVDSLPKREDGSIDRVKVKAIYGSIVNGLRK